jgi:thioredoxin-like negative regulator of GroEL
VACLAAKPIVNGIERDLEGTATVVRLDLMSEVGRRIARRYDVRAIPTILIFDRGEGPVFRHMGIPGRQQIVDEVLALRERG